MIKFIYKILKGEDAEFEFTLELADVLAIGFVLLFITGYLILN